MRRKNRKWVALGVGLYLLVWFSAFRWSIAQRPKDGNILDQRDREAIRKLAEQAAKEAAAGPQPTGEAKLIAAGPAFVAARYDATHVVFMVTAETEARFAATLHSSGTPKKISLPAKVAAPLAGLQELWEPDSDSLHFFPKLVQQTKAGEQWSLNVSPDWTIPVEIERTVVAPTGCSLAMGFLATVLPAQQSGFSESREEYFAIRRTAVESSDPPMNSRIAELKGWRFSDAAAKEIEHELEESMKHGVEDIDARLIANSGSPGATAGESPVGHPHPRLKEWLHVDRGLLRGEGKLDYDVRAFRLTPDGLPRLFVRARWKLANAPVFLMTAWFKSEAFRSEAFKSEMSGPAVPTVKSAALQQKNPHVVTLLSADASWSSILREGDDAGSLGENLDFQSVLNEFDADRDGWAELLIHSNQGTQSLIGLYQYSDLGLAQLKTPLRRDNVTPEACVDP